MIVRDYRSPRGRDAGPTRHWSVLDLQEAGVGAGVSGVPRLTWQQQYERTMEQRKKAAKA